jgi:uncharacterized membrane protein
LVNEFIKYDFGDTDHHGIYRYIPVDYQTPFGNKSIKLEIQSVTRDGNSESFTLSKIGSNENIKIGDPNITISGEHAYTIIYKVTGAIGYFDNYDELYWNITGNGWPVAILSAGTSIELPQTPNTKILETSCYLGVYGSQEKCTVNTQGNTLVIGNSPRILSPGEGITLAVGFPKGVVYEPTQLENLISTIKDNTILFLPLLFLIVMFLIWRKYGRDPKGLSTIIAEYEPPENMKPTLVGSLVDGKVDPRDITAGLIYLAEQGFIKITRVEKKWFLGNIDYELELLKNDTTLLGETEKGILNLFFSDSSLAIQVAFSQTSAVGTVKRISELRSDIKFKLKINGVTSDIYQEMTDKGFYVKNPTKVKAPFFFVAPVFIFLAIFFNSTLGMSGILSFIISGAIFLIFGLMMGKKTKLGAETRDHILGFKQFLSVTEKDRLNFHNAPEKKPEQFMQFLPYAIALGVENKWAKQFEGVYLTQPSWYHSNVAGAFIATDFVSHMSGFSQTLANTAMAGGAGSGGGGFSGGGGGGGGGGSW